MKKSQKQLIKEAFTKPFDDRYTEAPKKEKVGHWIFIGSCIAIIAIILCQ